MTLSINARPHVRRACLHGEVTPEDFLERSPTGLAVYRQLVLLFASRKPDVTVRVSKSQVAFCRDGRGFAYLWHPGQYLHGPTADVVVAIALREELPSPRFKEIAHPSSHVWMHHLEVSRPDEVDAELERWLLRAADEAVLAS